MKKLNKEIWAKLFPLLVVGAVLLSPVLSVGNVFAEDVEFSADELAGMTQSEMQAVEEIEALDAELSAEMSDMPGADGIDASDATDAQGDMEEAIADLVENGSAEELAEVANIFESVTPATLENLNAGAENDEDFLPAIIGPVAKPALTYFGKKAIGKIGKWISKKQNRTKALNAIKKVCTLAKKMKSSPKVLNKWVKKPLLKKFPWKPGFKPFITKRPLVSPLKPGSWIKPPVLGGANAKVRVTARVAYGPVFPPSLGKLQIRAPKQIHLKATRPGKIATKNLPVTITNQTGKVATLKVYGAKNLKKTFGIGPKNMATQYSLTRSSVPAWKAAPAFSGVTSGSNSIAQGSTNLNLRCAVVATRSMRSGAIYSDTWGMRAYTYRGRGTDASAEADASAGEDESAISEEEDVEESDMTESEAEEVTALEDGQGEDVEELITDVEEY